MDSFFFRLPLEVRESIYQYCFRDGRGWPMCKDVKDATAYRTYVRNSRLLLVCRQVYLEALTVYGQTLQHKFAYGEKQTLTEYASSMASHFRLNLTTLYIHLNKNKEDGRHEIWPEELGSWFPRLRYVHIQAPYNYLYLIPTMPTHQMDDASFLTLLSQHNPEHIMWSLVNLRLEVSEDSSLVETFVTFPASTDRALQVYCPTCWGGPQNMRTTVALKRKRVIRYLARDVSEQDAAMVLLGKVEESQVRQLKDYKCLDEIYHSTTEGWDF